MQKKGLRVRISYESNRMAKSYLSAAYEALIPVIKQPINSSREEVRSNEKEQSIQPLRRNLQ